MQISENPSIIYEYHSLLLGNQQSLPLSNNRNKREKKKNAIYILRYAVENLLKWDPTDMKNHFNKEVVEKMRLQRVLEYIDTPPEVDKRDDFSYYAHILYPEKITYKFRDVTIAAYKHFFANPNAKIPKGFFTDARGKDRAIYCLQYLLDKEKGEKTIDDLYCQFADHSIDSYLEKHKLLAARKKHFASGLDYLSATMMNTPLSRVLYHFYRTIQETCNTSPLRFIYPPDPPCPDEYIKEKPESADSET